MNSTVIIVVIRAAGGHIPLAAAIGVHDENIPKPVIIMADIGDLCPIGGNLGPAAPFLVNSVYFRVETSKLATSQPRNTFPVKKISFPFGFRKGTIVLLNGGSGNSGFEIPVPMSNAWFSRRSS